MSAGSLSLISGQTWVSEDGQSAEEELTNDNFILVKHGQTMYGVFTAAVGILLLACTIRSAVVLAGQYDTYMGHIASETHIETFQAVSELQQIVYKESFARVKFLTSGFDGKYYTEMSDIVKAIDDFFARNARTFSDSFFNVPEYRRYNCSFYSINSNLHARTSATPVNQHRTLDERQINPFDDMDYYECLAVMLGDYQAQTFYTSPGFDDMWQSVYAYVTASKSLISYEIALNYAFLTRELVLKRGSVEFQRQKDASLLEEFIIVSEDLLKKAYEIAPINVGMSSVPAIHLLHDLLNELTHIRNATKAYFLVTNGDKYEMSSQAKTTMTHLSNAKDEFEEDMIKVLETHTDDSLESLIGECIKLFLLAILLPLLSIQLIVQMHKETKRLDVRFKGTVDRYIESCKAIFRLLPEPVAKKLNIGKEVKPEYFNSVTAFVSDIVGFTSICAKLKANDVVNMLNNIYTIFDDRMSAYKCYKIETVGDAYIVASGVPIRIPNHSSEVALLALGLIEEVGLIKLPTKKGERIQIRVGINSGPVIAGIVGVKMLRYCLFGKTMLQAQKMEQTSLPQKIHISDSTRTELLQQGGFRMVTRPKDEWPERQPTHWLLSTVTASTMLSLFGAVNENTGYAHVVLDSRVSVR